MTVREFITNIMPNGCIIKFLCIIPTTVDSSCIPSICYQSIKIQLDSQLSEKSINNMNAVVRVLGPVLNCILLSLQSYVNWSHTLILF